MKMKASSAENCASIGDSFPLGRLSLFIEEQEMIGIL